MNLQLLSASLARSSWGGSSHELPRKRPLREPPPGAAGENPSAPWVGPRPRWPASSGGPGKGREGTSEPPATAAHVDRRRHAAPLHPSLCEAKTPPHPAGSFRTPI